MTDIGHGEYYGVPLTGEDIDYIRKVDGESFSLLTGVFRGFWATGASYIPGDMVDDGTGQLLLCLVEHSAGVEIDRIKFAYLFNIDQITDNSINEAQNVGPGAGVYQSVADGMMSLRSLVAGSNVTLQQNIDHLVISSTGGGGGGGSLDDLADVDTTGILEGYGIYWNGVNYTPGMLFQRLSTPLVPANVVLNRRLVFDTYLLNAPVTFVVGAGNQDGAEGYVNIISDGVSEITWDPKMRARRDRSNLPTTLPLGDNSLNMEYVAADDVVLVNIQTLDFQADGSVPMNGNVDMDGNDILNVGKVKTDYIHLTRATGPTSGNVTPTFGTHNEFFYGSLSGDLNIQLPTGQVAGQTGTIEFNNAGGWAVTLDPAFHIMNGQDPAIPSARVVLTYRVFEVDYILYSIRTG